MQHFVRGSREISPMPSLYYRDGMGEISRDPHTKCCIQYIECTDALILYARFCDRKVYHHRPVPTTLSRHSHDQIVTKEHLTPSLNAPCSNIFVDGH